MCIRILQSQWWDQMSKDSWGSRRHGAFYTLVFFFFCSCVAFSCFSTSGDQCEEIGVSVSTVSAKESLSSVCFDPANHKVEEQHQRALPVFYVGALAGFLESENIKAVDVFMVPFSVGLKPKGQLVTVPGDVGEGTRWMYFSASGPWCTGASAGACVSAS